MSPSPYIWTEALGCGEILPPMLSSFLYHHNFRIHVYIYEEDLEFLPDDNRVIPELITESANSLIQRKSLELSFQRGHAGTAQLWANIICRESNRALIHLDADTIFLGNVVDPLLQHQEDFSVVGSRRPYRNTEALRGIRKNHLRFRPDAVNTHCFLFNATGLTLDVGELTRKITANSQKKWEKIFRPVIDFFDPITFQLQKQNGIYYMDSSDQGKHGFYSREGSFESSMISFSAVGSGAAIYKNKTNSGSESYQQFALKSFALYSKELLKNDLDLPLLDSKFLRDKLANLDQNTWTLRN
jgi:hypothetical protein